MGECALFKVGECSKLLSFVQGFVERWQQRGKRAQLSVGG
jgi:hypothetical protein